MKRRSFVISQLWNKFFRHGYRRNEFLQKSGHNQVIRFWKVQHILKGLLTRVPPIDRLRRSKASTGGSGSARYCYSVWLRHLRILSAHKFRIQGAKVGELGPGDSIGIGLAAVLSGAESYVGLDIVPFSSKANLTAILEELFALFANQASIPDDREFPGVRPKLESYEFPRELVNNDLIDRAMRLKEEVRNGLNGGGSIAYKAPWQSPDVIQKESLDLIFSQAVLEHVDDLENTYRTMHVWLKPGGYVSHVIDFRAHHLSPLWDGHWAYTDLEWRLVRGRREYLLNRQPLSTHLRLAERAGFEIAYLSRDYARPAIGTADLAGRFRTLDGDDRVTCGAVIQMRKRA